MSRIVFLVEEPSMKELLERLLPRVLPPASQFLIIKHEGKTDLERSIPRKLRAWKHPQDLFVILRDQDGADCIEIKHRLRMLCENGGRSGTLIRIVCNELESWFLGDLGAVGAAFGLPHLADDQNKSKFRNPDNVGNAKEELKKLAGDYQPVSGARSIALHMDLEANRSRSFHCFLEGLRRITPSL